MHVVWEAILALLGAFGVLCIGWLLFGRLLSPAGWGRKPCIYTVLPTAGGGEGLEQAVRSSLWFQGGQQTAVRIVIADGGLDEAGRAAVSALVRQWPELTVCPLSEVTALLEEASPARTRESS